MRLSVEERGILLTGMSDESAAQTVGHSLAWVRAGRAWIAEEMRAWEEGRQPVPVADPEDLAAWDRLAAKAKAKAAPPGKRARAAVLDDNQAAPQKGRRVRRGGQAESAPPPAEAASGKPESPAAPPPETPNPDAFRFGAPEGLTGRDLAAWLYDNTDATFLMIADASGLTPAAVQAIADDDEGGVEPVVDTPAPIRRAPRAKPSAAPHAEIPAKVVRYARWFVDAGWRMADVARLFDVQTSDLRGALDQPLRRAA